jgi:hypothetical protein
VRRIALITIAAVSALAFASAGRSASTLCVGGPHCYSTVQAAVNAAQGGDTVRIGPDTFAGGITITKEPDPTRRSRSSTRRKNNALEGSTGVTLQGGGIFTLGFPLTLTSSLVKHNTPDDCFGC